MITDILMEIPAAHSTIAFPNPRGRDLPYRYLPHPPNRPCSILCYTTEHTLSHLSIKHKSDIQNSNRIHCSPSSLLLLRPTRKNLAIVISYHVSYKQAQTTPASTATINERMHLLIGHTVNYDNPLDELYPPNLLTYHQFPPPKPRILHAACIAPPHSLLFFLFFPFPSLPFPSRILTTGPISRRMSQKANSPTVPWRGKKTGASLSFSCSRITPSFNKATKKHLDPTAATDYRSPRTITKRKKGKKIYRPRSHVVERSEGKREEKRNEKWQGLRLPYRFCNFRENPGPGHRHIQAHPINPPHSSDVLQNDWRNQRCVWSIFLKKKKAAKTNI